MAVTTVSFTRDLFLEEPRAPTNGLFFFACITQVNITVAVSYRTWDKPPVKV